MKALLLSALVALGSLVHGNDALEESHASLLKRQATACASLVAPEIGGATVVGFTATPRPTASTPYCAVDVFLTHGTKGDRVRIATWLPLAGWTGRYQGTGGGGMSAGSFDSALAPAVAQGYVAGSTDAGLPSSFDGAAWANNTQLIINFAYLSVHEMTVIGKLLAKQFYGREVQFSYWNGCSTGGRQGVMEVQRFPLDYDGVYAAAPAVNWDRFHVAMIWPFIVQTVEREFVPQCIFTALTNGAIAACDMNDNAADGIIVDPPRCAFDATTMVGQTATCGSATQTITARQALIWNKIRQGPVDTSGAHLWSGIVPGAPYSGIATNPPFFLSSSWIRNFVLKQPSFDLSTLTYADFPRILAQSHAKYQCVIGTDNPNLSRFRDNGGKLLMWHGWADQLIFANGSVDYRLAVERTMGGARRVDDFYRFYLAPGVQHCSGGTGAAPTNPLNVLVDWVERGVVPNTLPATGPAGMTRNLCRFPTTLRYTGVGDVRTAASWTCV